MVTPVSFLIRRNVSIWTECDFLFILHLVFYILFFFSLFSKPLFFLSHLLLLFIRLLKVDMAVSTPY